MTLETPIIYEDKTYTELAENLSYSIVPRGTSGYTIGLNLIYTPMRILEDGSVELIDKNAVDENGKSLIYQILTPDLQNTDVEIYNAFSQLLENIYKTKNG